MAAGLFSVIVPVYNRAGSLQEALESVRHQTYRPIEIVVVDDGSTDRSPEVAREWAATHQDDGLKVVVYSQPNQGPGAARNAGLEMSTGSYIQYLDSDDLLHPDRLSRLVEVFGETGADLLQTGYEIVDQESEEVIATMYGRKVAGPVELALYGYLMANTLRSAMTGELARRIGPWRTDLRCFEDREYFERAVCQAQHPFVIRDVLAKALRHSGGRVSDLSRTEIGRDCRIQCEEGLARALRGREGVSKEAWSAFASRIFGLAIRTKASGWKGLGDRCVRLADGVGAELDFKGKIRRAIARSGRWGCWLYGVVGRARGALSRGAD